MYEFLQENWVDEDKRAALWCKALGDESIVFEIVESIWQLDISSDAFPRITEHLWELADAYEDIILTFFEEIFEYDEEIQVGYEDNDDAVIAYAQGVIKFIKNREIIWKDIPEKYHQKLKIYYDQTLLKLIKHDIPYIQIRAYEAIEHIYFKRYYDRKYLEGPDLSAMPQEYVDICVKAIDLISDVIDNPRWSLILDRIEFLRQRAHAAGDSILELFTRFLAKDIKIITPGGYDEIVEDFSRLLFSVGYTSIPMVTHKAYLNRPSKMWYRFYDEWTTFATVNNDQEPTAIKSPLPNLSTDKLNELVSSQPYAVFLECSSRITAERSSELIKIADQAATVVRHQLLNTNSEDDIKAVTHEFAEQFDESLYYSGDPSETLDQALNILEKKLADLTNND